MEEAVQMVGSAARAGVEISVELLKILIPALARGSVKLIGESGKLLGAGLRNVKNAIANAKAEGTVSRKNLLAIAAAENSPVKHTESFPQDVTDRLTEMAKQYKIPISVNGNGSTRSISFLERDSDIVEQMMQDWQAEKLAPKEGQQALKSFAVRDEKNLDAIKSKLEQNGVECWFTQKPDGEIRCNFKAEDLGKAQQIMQDFQKNQTEIAENCKVELNVPENERQIEISDQIDDLQTNLSLYQSSLEEAESPEIRERLEENIQDFESQIENLQREYDAEKVNAFNSAENKFVTVTNEYNGNSVEIAVDADLRKSDVVEIFREELGYSTEQAELAANKLASEAGLGENFFAEPSQTDMLDKMQVNIRYPSDDMSIQAFSFSAVKFNDGENVHITVGLGDDSVMITPAELSDEELKSVFTDRLGMTEKQAEKCVAKSRKIDAQIQNKLHETVYERADQQRTVSIERTSHGEFTVTSGNVTKSYNFAQVNLEESISRDFNIPSKNAHNVVSKAKSQSVIQNKLHRNSEKKRKAAKVKKDPFKKFGAGKKVKR